MFFRRLLFFLLLLLGVHRHAPAKSRQAPVPPVAFPGPETDPDREAGLPLIHNFHPRAYASASSFVDNFAVLQDSTGRIFVGNTGGVLIYNGVNWQFVETPTKSLIRSLALHPAGHVYVGASDDLGYLDRDVAGKLHFVSLLPHLPPDYRAFGDVRYTVTAPEGVYFLTSAHLFRWDGRRMRRWDTSTQFQFMHRVGGTLFVQQAGQGLYVLEKEELRTFAASGPFTHSGVAALLPASDGQLLVATRNRGLFRMAGNRCTPFGSGASVFLEQHECYRAATLPDGGYAFATGGGGVLLTDAAGNVRRILNKETGLISNTVFGLSTDRQGGLWMATNNGVSRLETFSPFSQFGESNGLAGNIQELRRYRGKLYASTSAGLFVLETEAGTGRTARFEAVPGFTDRVMRLFLFKDRMLIAGNKHLYEMTGEQIRIVKPDFKVTGLHQWRRDPNLLFATSNGLFALRWTEGGWRDEGRVPGIHEDIHTTTETPAGDLYLATRWQGTLRVRFPRGQSGDLQKAQLQQPDILRYGAAQGLPSGVNRFYWAGNRLLLRIGEDNFTLHELDQATGQFKTLANPGPGIGAGVVKAYPALDTLSAGWWWTQFPADKKWSLTRVPAGPGDPRTPTHYNLNRITEYTGKSLYVEGDTVVWFRGIEGVVRYHLRQPARGTGAFRVLLDRVVVNGDSALYPHDGLRAAELPYAYNTLRFEYAAPAYDGAAENEFQYQLAGYDRDWSAWTKDFYKEYTRIPEGRYTFRVRARNLYGKLGTEAAYTVTIAPPWYRTWPVYAAYVLLATGLLYGLVRRRMAALQQRNLELEKIVRDRTWEIATKNQQLDAQNAQLQAQAGQLARQTAQLLELDEMKSNFFANISHEFRTPLTLVLGILNDKAAKGDARDSGAAVPVSPREISVMQRNARRLLQLINQLLDLSRIDSGRMKLHLQDGNLAELLALVAASFASLAEYRNIRFQVQLPDGPLYCRFDADKLEKVLYNLLANAFKFTPYGGTVSLEVNWEPAPAGPSDPGAAPGRLRVGVRDSGPGIPADQVEKVFDRFFQGAQLYQGDAQGTGIGLALTRELVQLHGGRIWAESPGGAYFGVELPLATVPPTESTTAPSLSATFGSGDWAGGDEGTPPAPAPGDPNRVSGLPLLLIVEDNADLRGYIRGHLEDKYRVVECENGIAGWEMALEHLPDLLISDWMMPGMNGVQLLERVKTDERTSHIPFILLTALATDEGKLTGLETGADEYLTKPFDARELELRIRNLIETRRRLRERFAREVRLQPKDIAVTSTDERFMEKVMAIVEEHLGDADFGAEQFGREVGLSRMQLHRKLTALTGQSTGDFIRTMRLKRAAQLLEARAGTVSEIAFTVGYGSLSYFTRSFREQFGVNPSEYVAKVVSGQS